MKILVKRLKYPFIISVAWEPLGGPAEKLDKSGPPRFEAYMMTGDLILNLSRTQQSSLLPKHNKKVDSLLLRHHHNYRNHQHHNNSVPTSPNESDLGIKSHNLGKLSYYPLKLNSHLNSHLSNHNYFLSKCRHALIAEHLSIHFL